MKDLFMALFLFTALSIYQGCTPSQETASDDKDEEEVYVFDQVPETTPAPEVTEQLPEPPYYIVQIGAFTTKDKADVFASESRKNIANEVEVKFSDQVNLYVVQIKPYFKTRNEAENVRNKLWQSDGYQDAWIVTVE